MTEKDLRVLVAHLERQQAAADGMIDRLAKGLSTALSMVGLMDASALSRRAMAEQETRKKMREARDALRDVGGRV